MLKLLTFEYGTDQDLLDAQYIFPCLYIHSCISDFFDSELSVKSVRITIQQDKGKKGVCYLNFKHYGVNYLNFYQGGVNCSSLNWMSS